MSLLCVNMYNAGLGYICQRNNSWTQTRGIGVPDLWCHSLAGASGVSVPLTGVGGSPRPSAGFMSWKTPSADSSVREKLQWDPRSQPVLEVCTNGTGLLEDAPWVLLWHQSHDKVEKIERWQQLISCQQQLKMSLLQDILKDFQLVCFKHCYFKLQKF